MINHRAINNRYFSSNVYRVRFKRLVKTNLRPRALFAPLGPPHPDTRWTTRATGIYHGRKLRDLARNLSAPMEKVGGESASLPRAPFLHRGELREQRASPRLASHARLDRPIFLRAPPPPRLLYHVESKIPLPRPLTTSCGREWWLRAPSFPSAVRKRRGGVEWSREFRVERAIDEDFSFLG